MGASDVIPGVSGGTMALILGIYRRLVGAISGLHVRWVPPLWRWMTQGRRPEDWAEFRDEFATLEVPFLATLAAGIVVAVLVGGLVIPVLMERYPVAMDGFFFGLIAASVWVPFRMLQTSEGGAVAGAVAVGIAAAAIGYTVTNPDWQTDFSQTWKSVESGGETLEEISRRGPSASTVATVYWSERNERLRSAIRGGQPELAEELASYREEAIPEGGSLPSKEELEKMSEPFRNVRVPEGVEVFVPRPAGWYVFGAGAVAICAMILPGISGSYLLLILGVYFFVLNAVKGAVELVLDGSVPVEHAGFVGLFATGAAVGLLSFARFLNHLLSSYTVYTLAALVGLMVGCLRGIWPFQTRIDGRVVNHVPEAMGPEVYSALGAALLGVAIVGGLTYAGRSRTGTGGSDAPPTDS